MGSAGPAARERPAQLRKVIRGRIPGFGLLAGLHFLKDSLRKWPAQPRKVIRGRTLRTDNPTIRRLRIETESIRGQGRDQPAKPARSQISQALSQDLGSFRPTPLVSQATKASPGSRVRPHFQARNGAGNGPEVEPEWGHFRDPPFPHFLLDSNGKWGKGGPRSGPLSGPVSGRKWARNWAPKRDANGPPSGPPPGPAGGEMSGDEGARPRPGSGAAKKVDPGPNTHFVPPSQQPRPSGRQTFPRRAALLKAQRERAPEAAGSPPWEGKPV